MPSRFYMRFNLHSSAGHFPVSVDIFERLLPDGREKLQAELDDFERIQSDRITKLKKNFPSEIEKIKNKKVLFVGDSITSDNLGYRASVTRAASLVAYDASISGGMSSMMLQDTQKLAKLHSPDIISIMIGTNDSISIDGVPVVSAEEYERNLRALVGWAKQSGATVLLFEIPPINESSYKRLYTPLSQTQSNDNIRKYNRVLEKIAEEKGIGLISNQWILEGENMFEPDGIHLSVGGQEKFAENWLIKAAEQF